MRRQRYSSEAADNPVYVEDLDLAAREKDEAESSTPSGPKRDGRAGGFVFTVIDKHSKAWDLPDETGKHISEFILREPSGRVDRIEAVKRGWIHWLVSFSSVRNGDIDLATHLGNLDGALMIHNRLQAEGRLTCSKRFMYLTVEQGEYSFVQWHVTSCEAHSFEDWMYAATWIGRKDVVDWLHENIANLQHFCRKNTAHAAGLGPCLLLSCPSASFSSVAERFESELMEFEDDMSELELAARDGLLDLVELFVQPKAERISLEDRLETRISGNALNLAAIHGHLGIVQYLHQNDRARASVGGLYGAIVRGHLDVVRYLYDIQPELVSWPPIEDGPQVLRVFMTPINRGMLHFFRQERNMRLTARDWQEAVLRGDLASVRIFPQLDLVDWNEVSASIADLAAVRGEYCMLRALCRARHCFSTRAMDGAVEGGHLRIVKFLNEAGAPCTRRAVDLAALNGHEDVVRFLMERRHEGCSSYALYWASVNGHEGVVRYLALKQAPCDVDMCLTAARSQGHEATVGILKEYGVLSGLARTTKCSSRHSVRWRQRAEANMGVVLSSTVVVIHEIYKLLGVSMPTSDVEDLQSHPRKKRRVVVKNEHRNVLIA